MELWRVRGVEGVDWAVRLYKGITRARLEEGTFQQIIMIGLDDATMVGAPREIVVGSIDDLRRPDAVIMDEAGFHQLWPDEPFAAGKVFEMNDRRAVVVGVCKSRKTFMTFPIIYTRYSQAVSFVPMERKVLSFILANPKPGVSAEEVCRRIEAQTDLQGQTRAQFEWTTIWYYFRKTGIPFNLLHHGTDAVNEKNKHVKFRSTLDEHQRQPKHASLPALRNHEQCTGPCRGFRGKEAAGSTKRKWSAV